MSKTYGSHRTVVGAHYGVRDWLAQRGTAIVIVAFTLALLAQILFSSGPIGYDVWAGIFAAQWMKVLTFATIIAVAWHAWIGVRNVWMDYAKLDGLRYVLYMLTLVWLVGCTAWAFQVLWRL
ncbi:MAG: succinate dehydrogenase, hydrophobic membrane anchor protein [Acidovorax sp.]|jgi:succinate dehydrogenase / fumarate reductase membrane anchor subunit|nr:succinate dehydrogenase, hydrophobic membrane anchor protein [Acidovorax sp.]